MTAVLSSVAKTLPKCRNTSVSAALGRVYQNPSMGTCPSMTIAENMALADNKGKAFNLRPGTNKQRLEFYRESLRSLGLGLEE